MRVLITVIIALVAAPTFAIAGTILFLGSLILPGMRFFLARNFARLMILVLGIRLSKVGKFPQGGPFVVMTNHSSFIDPLLILTVLEQKFTAVVATYNFRFPIWAQLLRRYRAISVTRGKAATDIRRIKMAEQIIKEEGYHVVILPEGTRTLTGKMGPLKKGGFHLAMNTRTPILPVGFEGAFNYKPKYRNTLRPGKIILRIGDPIPVDEYDELDPSGLMERTAADLRRLCGESD